MQRYPQGSVAHPGRVLVIAAIVIAAGAASVATGAASPELVRLGGAALAVLLIVSGVVLQRWQGAVATVVTAAAAFGVVAVAARALVAPPLAASVVLISVLAMQATIYVAVAYAAQVRHERSHDRPAPRDHRYVLSEALRGARGAMVLGTIVTALGFGWLAATNAGELRALGGLMILGALATGVGASTIYPAVVALVPYQVPTARGLGARLGALAIRAPLPLLALAVAGVALGGIAASRAVPITGVAIAAAIIGLVAATALGSVTLGVAAAVASLGPAVAVVAVRPAGPIEPLTAGIVALALGVAATATVQFAATWRVRRRLAGADPIAAVTATVAERAPAIALAAIAVASGGAILVIARAPAAPALLLCAAAGAALGLGLLAVPAIVAVLARRPAAATTGDELGSVGDFRKTTADHQRTTFADYSDDEIATITTADFLALAGKTVIRHGGSNGTRRLLVELDAQAGQRILELGAGVGATAFDLATADPSLRVTGVDLSAFMVQQSRQRAQALGLGDRVELVHSADPNALPFADDTFDIVIAESVAMYNDAQPFFREILRVLKPGGRIGLHDWCWIEKPSEGLENATCMIACGCNPGDVKFFTQDDWESSLGRQGFRIRFAAQYPFTFFSWSSMQDDEGLWGLLKMFGRVLSRRATAQRMIRMMAFLARHEARFGYTVTIGQKPEPDGQRVVAGGQRDSTPSAVA